MCWFNYTEKSMWSNGYFLMSQGFRGSCLEGKLIAEFTKQAWNVCWSALGEDERVPFLGSEDASWLALGESLDWTSGAGSSEEQPAAPIAQDVY